VPVHTHTPTHTHTHTPTHTRTHKFIEKCGFYNNHTPTHLTIKARQSFLYTRGLEVAWSILLGDITAYLM